ncbi:MAG: DUF1350 family protein [Cyanobacteria bacterium]|nr:DUF1350 family protein [Cyanobacteriota bacterium]MDW8200114.1 DUF1350 family protein [Cyanobacteriota bacterium SKYGB_h_bin112]
MEWQELAGNWALVPRRHVGIIHFLGGAFVATAPQVTYRRLLEKLSDRGYIVIATPFVNTLDHRTIAQEVLTSFERTMDRLDRRGALRRRYLPIYGLGHSLGCKLHLLIGSLFSVERAGNILIATNNYAFNDAIPMVSQLDLPVEFTPTPRETEHIINQSYHVKRNLLVQFTDDTIDQSAAIYKILHRRFADMVTLRRLRGNHLTPLGAELTWQPGTAFSPLDALGQWFNQVVYQELTQLQQEILQWLNPLMVMED